MGWADWMIVDLPLEEQLTVEQQIRAAKNCEDVDEVRELCGQLLRSATMQKTLLRQAVSRIAELEQTVEVLEAKKPKGAMMRLWKTITTN